MHPAQIGPYRLGAKLGEGGMGIVYAAEDEKSRRKVAVKLLRPEWSQEPKAVERFHREARICTTLHHPHICAIYDFGEHDGYYYLITERLEGQPLCEKLDGWPLAIETLLDIGIQIADALEAAHSQGVIHRDVKSSNIFITDTGIAKLFDFGLAKLCDPDGSNAEPHPAQPREIVSMPGFTLGTVTHMSPEQVAGKELDPRSDIFSFGIVLYEMATGVLPFRGLDSINIMQAIASEPYPLPSKINPNLPPELDAIIGKSLEKDCAARYQAMSELRAELTHLLQNLEQPSSPTTAGAAPATASPAADAPAAAADASAEPQPEGATSPVPQAVVEQRSNSGGRDFLVRGRGTLYWFRACLGEVSSPRGFRDSLQPALDNPRIPQIRFVLDPVGDGSPQLWSQLVTPLIQSWALRHHLQLEAEVIADRGRFYDPVSHRTRMSWIFADLSEQAVPSFKIFSTEPPAAPRPDCGPMLIDAELLVATRLRSIRMRDGSRQDLRIPERVLRLRTGGDELLLSSLMQLVRRFEKRFDWEPA